MLTRPQHKALGLDQHKGGTALLTRDEFNAAALRDEADENFWRSLAETPEGRGLVSVSRDEEEEVEASAARSHVANGG